MQNYGIGRAETARIPKRLMLGLSGKQGAYVLSATE